MSHAQLKTVHPSQPDRALGLDALRGLAVVLMCLSGVVPNWLPNAMYHGYYPRYLPDEAGRWQAVENPWLFRGDWPGFTWVDWVFPMFLFAMGAAIPLAMASRLERGTARWRLVLGVVWRWLVLIGFAVYVRQIDPHLIDPEPGPRAWLLAILGFVLLFPVFTRLPKSFSSRRVVLIRCGGVAACVGLVVAIHFGSAAAFVWSQHDIIILLLAHGSLLAGLAYLLLLRRPIARLLLLLPIAFIAHHQAMAPQGRLLADRLDAVNPWLNTSRQWLDFTWLSQWTDGRIPSNLLDFSPLWDFTWLKFLWIIVPGMVIGDLMLRASGRSGESPDPIPQLRWPTARLLAIAMLMSLAIVIVFAGAKDHGQQLMQVAGFKLITPYAAIILAGPILLSTGLCMLKPTQREDQLLVSLYAWGVSLLLLGLLLNLAPQVQLSSAGQPFTFSMNTRAVFEGGIKKGPPATLAYYLASAGLSVLALLVLTVVVDRWRAGRRVFWILIVNGQNPMLAYAGIRSLLGPIVSLPLLAPLGLAGVKSLDALGFTWIPRQIASWRQQAELAGEPWVLFVWSVCKTLLLAVFVGLMTRLRLVWRS